MKNSANSTAHAYKDNAEPRVEELLADPIVRQLMRSDNVQPEFIDRLQQQVDSMRARLASLNLQ
ncbi:MAG: hypothetical protein C0436_02465 [Alphaproteobacteria bacterium]|nr:hypothetical protein [Alphaproteobacteria bacterium]